MTWHHILYTNICNLHGWAWNYVIFYQLVRRLHGVSVAGLLHRRLRSEGQRSTISCKGGELEIEAKAPKEVESLAHLRNDRPPGCLFFAERTLTRSLPFELLVSRIGLPFNSSPIAWCLCRYWAQGFEEVQVTWLIIVLRKFVIRLKFSLKGHGKRYSPPFRHSFS